jgi:hypothetical protein
MLRAIADGEDDPKKLANFARRTMKKKKEELELALQGYVNPHQRLMLKTILTHIDFLTEQIEMLDQEIAKRVSSYEKDIERLDSIPGIAREWLNKSWLKSVLMLKINFLLRHIFAHGQLSYPGIMKVLGKENQLDLKKEISI